MKPISFYLVTDTHYYDPDLGASGPAYEEYMKTEQYFLKESSTIIETVFDKLAQDKDTNIVVIPGDLSKNGEKTSHIGFVKELNKLKQSGKDIFVITAGHDYHEYSTQYIGNDRVPVEGASFEELYDFYYDFGYSNALSVDKDTLSYMAQVADGVRMLALNCDAPSVPKGTIDDRLMQWAKEQIDDAKNNNCFVFAICHYPIIPPVPVFDLVGDTKVRDWRKVASFLADNGVQLAFTGHMHIQSINEFVSEKGNKLVDICTACLVGSPAKYRKITIDTDAKMTVESIDVDGFDCDLNGLTYQQWFDNQFAYSIQGRINKMLRGDSILKKALRRIIPSITVGGLGRLLWIKVDKSIAATKLMDLAGDIGVAIFKGDMPYVAGTPVFEAVSKVLKRFRFIIKKVEPKIAKNGAKIDLTQMLYNTIGNNKGWSDNNAVIQLKK